MNQYEQSALNYAKSGFEVFPLTPNSKTPLKGTHGSKDATTDTQQIKTWWHDHPTANIGVTTRSFFVLDVDVNHADGQDGRKSLEVLQNSKGKLPPTHIVLTANGGEHWYYQKPQGMTLPQKIAFLKGVDIKAHPNNYVLVPPSQIAHSDGHIGVYKTKPGSPSQIAIAPTWLTDFILAYNHASKPTQQPSNGVVKRYRTETTERLESIAKGFLTGQRNDGVARLTGYLLAHAVDVELVLKLVQYANGNSPEPLPDAEVERTFMSIAKRELGVK